jgi:hypothetical protein
VNDIEKLYGFARFVRLQMPDKMPFDHFSADFQNFAFCFLNFIFAENARVRSRRDCRSQNFNRMHFADGDKFYFVRISSAFSRRLFNLSLNFRKVLTQIIFRFRFAHLLKYIKISYKLF